MGVPDTKVEAGVVVITRQRANRENVVPSGSRISIGQAGDFVVATDVGEDRGIYLNVSIKLEEILSWLPEMTEKAKQYSAAEAQRAERIQARKRERVKK